MPWCSIFSIQYGAHPPGVPVGDGRTELEVPLSVGNGGVTEGLVDGRGVEDEGIVVEDAELMVPLRDEDGATEDLLDGRGV